MGGFLGRGSASRFLHQSRLWLRGSGKIVRIRILFENFSGSGSDQFQKIVMGSHKIQIFSRTNLAIATKLPYFWHSYGYKRNLPQNNQKIFNFFVILMQKSKISRDFHKNPTDLANGSGSVNFYGFGSFWPKKHGSA